MLDTAAAGCVRHPEILAGTACAGCGRPLCAACGHSLQHRRCGDCRAAAGEPRDVVDGSWRVALLVDGLRQSFAALPRRAPAVAGTVVVGLAFAWSSAHDRDAHRVERLAAPAPPLVLSLAMGSRGDAAAVGDGATTWRERVVPRACSAPVDVDDATAARACPWRGDAEVRSDAPDADLDGVPDAAEPGDADADGIADAIDPVVSRHGLRSDDDLDGNPNALERCSSPFSWDSDGDGLSDRHEQTPDRGTPGGLDPSVACIDSDGDGAPDALDEDSDDDGVPDAHEGVLLAVDQHASDGSVVDEVKWFERDVDGDGVRDERDADDDDDGIPTRFDAGGDGTRAYHRDGDADGDEDVVEAYLDRNGDGFADEEQADDEVALPRTEVDRVRDFRSAFVFCVVVLRFLLQPLLSVPVAVPARRRAFLARAGFSVVIVGLVVAVGLLASAVPHAVTGACAAVVDTIVLPWLLIALGAVVLGDRPRRRGALGALVAHGVLVASVACAQRTLALSAAIVAAAAPSVVADVVVCAVAVVAVLITLVAMGGFATGSARFASDLVRVGGGGAPHR